MSIDPMILIREYEQTIRDLGARLANAAVRESQLIAQVKELEQNANARTSP